MSQHQEIIMTKLGMVMGVMGWVSLSQANEIAKLILTCITIVSFSIVIIINYSKAESQIKKWFKK